VKGLEYSCDLNFFLTCSTYMGFKPCAQNHKPNARGFEIAGSKKKKNLAHANEMYSVPMEYTLMQGVW
jgi:hypothetical protein